MAEAYAERARFALGESLTMEVAIVGSEPPWSQTSQFLVDIASVMRRALVANFIDADDYEFVVATVHPGSLHFLGSLRRRGTKRRKTGRRGRGRADDAHQGVVQGFASNVLSGTLAAVLATTITGSASPTPVQPPHGVVVPTISQEMLDRLDRYVRLHSERVTLRITGSDGSTFELTLTGSHR